MRPSFGDLLRFHRENAEVTLTALGHYLELKVPYLSDVERGLRPPLTRERILKSAEFFGCGPELLLAAAARQAGIIPDAQYSPETEVAIGTFLLNIDTITAEQWQRIADIAGDPDGIDAVSVAEVVEMRPIRDKKTRDGTRRRAKAEVADVARPPARHRKTAGR